MVGSRDAAAAQHPPCGQQHHDGRTARAGPAPAPNGRASRPPRRRPCPGARTTATLRQSTWRRSAYGTQPAAAIRPTTSNEPPIASFSGWSDEVVQHRDGQDRAARPEQPEAEADRERAEQGEQHGWRAPSRIRRRTGRRRPAPVRTAGAGRTIDVLQQRHHPRHRPGGQRVVDRLGFAPRIDEPGLAQQREVLRQRGLAQLHALVQLAHRQRPLEQVAQDQQSLLVAERLQQLRGVATRASCISVDARGDPARRAVRCGVGRRGDMRRSLHGHAVHCISLLTKLAITNIVPSSHEERIRHAAARSRRFTTRPRAPGPTSSRIPARARPP